MRWHYRIILAFIAVALVALPSCRRKPAQQVVLYVSADEHLAREVIERFQKQSGISVSIVGDTEAKKTSGLVDRLRAEKAQPRADVFWSSEIIQTIALAEEGLLQVHLSDATKDWPRDWRDGQRQWFAFAARPRVIVFAPDRLPEVERPTTWMHLTQPRWRDKIVMADPRFGTTGTHLAAMLAHWDRSVMPGYFRAWCEGLAANNVRILPSGNAGVVAAVASGEAELGLTDADDVWAARARGLAVDVIYPDHDLKERASDSGGNAASSGGGTLLIPNTVARVKGGPNPQNAGALIDFLLSEEVERLLAESVSHNIAMRESVRNSFPMYDVPNPLEVDWPKAASLREKALQQFFAGLESVKAERAAVTESRREESHPASAPVENAADDAQRP